MLTAAVAAATVASAARAADEHIPPKGAPSADATSSPGTQDDLDSNKAATAGAALSANANANANSNASASTATEASSSSLGLRLNLEPALALPVSSPQTDHFGLGGGAIARIGFGVHPWVDLQAGAGAFTFRGKKTDTAPGNSVGIATASLGVRIQAPHRDRSLSPWFDANLGLAHTGSLNRLGFDVGAGLHFGLGEQKQFWLGPFVRYLQITSSDKVGVDGSDARIVILGLSLEFDFVSGEKATDTSLRDKDGDGVLDASDKCPSKPGSAAHSGCPDSDGDGFYDDEDKCPEASGTKSNGGCPASNKDSDEDGVKDAVDRCPNVKGDPDNGGCPRYKQIVVKDAKIELSQKIYFAFDQATILPKSFDLLDEVGQALNDAPKLRCRIEGHTDGTGTYEHNMALSASRASAVREYLIAQGVTPDRLEAKGYGPTLPLESNATAEGRERNRRVEFVILK